MYAYMTGSTKYLKTHREKVSCMLTFEIGSCETCIELHRSGGRVFDL